MNLNILKETFVNFVRSHGMGHHFRRLLILDMFLSSSEAKEVTQSLAQTLIEASEAEPAFLLKKLGSHVDGLTDSDAERLREKFGLNEVAHEKPMPWWMHLWHCFRNPFNILLTVLGVVSYFSNDIDGSVIIGSMVLLSTIMRFVQEVRSNNAADKLKEMVSNTATVMRHDLAEDAAAEARKYFDIVLHPKGPSSTEVPIKMLVPGDIVRLSAGDMIPADLRVLTAKDLFVSQAAMTGESLPVEKFALNKSGSSHNPLELDNICFMGTNVVSGSATAVVVGTGNRTYFGSLAERVTAADHGPTSFQEGVNKVSWLLIRFMLVMTPSVMILNGITKHDWVEAFLFALAIAVGLTPEMLPMIVTATLAKGAVVLSRKKVIVKRLDAIQNFGAMDVLCTDKTGTLTQDKIFLERHTDVFGEQSDHVWNYAFLNSYYQTGLKNLLDVAVLEYGDDTRHDALKKLYAKVDEIPFDFQRRRMSVVVSEGLDHHLLICKGAVEEILSICTRVQHRDQIEPLTEDLLKQVRAVTASLNGEGLRVVAVAAKESPVSKTDYSVADEQELVLIGYIAFLDPPKESTAPALEALKQHGVDVKILTGDNELVTAKICREVGLPVSGMLLGSAVEQMSDEELQKVAETTTVFAKLTPTHKERIVRVLHDKGHVVGFMGDGINDAPALRAADIGISVDSAVDIAKEAADLILLEKSLMVLEEGVIEGRKTFANMLKYIKMAASSNFGNVFSVLVASVFLPFLPMLPAQMLLQNLLYDISQIGIPFDNVDQEFIAKPQRWNPEGIGRFMIFFGPISSIFDITTFAVLWYVFGANSVDHASFFQSGWFVEGLLSQTLIVHMIRTERISFIQSRPSIQLLALTLCVMAAAVVIPYLPFAEAVKMQALPAKFMLCLLPILFSYAALTQLMKNWYKRRYGWQ